jgi:hypothetical protein
MRTREEQKKGEEKEGGGRKKGMMKNALAPAFREDNTYKEESI